MGGWWVVRWVRVDGGVCGDGVRLAWEGGGEVGWLVVGWVGVGVGGMVGKGGWVDGGGISVVGGEVGMVF